MNYSLVVVLGRLVRDPVMRRTTDDRACINFTLAINRKIKRPDSTVIDEATFCDVAMFGPRAESFAQYHRQGNHALVQGRLKTDRWPDKNNPGKELSKLTMIAESWEFVNQTQQETD